MTDYYPLPGDSVSIPNSSTPSTVPLDGGTASGGIVKLTAGEWEKRAQVAADGAARLLAAARTIRATATSNHFGECEEGDSMYRALGPVIRAWQDQLTSQAQQLETLARNCANAGPKLGTSDAQSAKTLEA